MKISITEIFNAVQGECIEVGTPTMFIRVHGCNMEPKCLFCDSSWTWKSKDSNILHLSELEELMKKSKFNHYTFTGGCPILYDKQITELRKHFTKAHFSVETNGLVKTKVNYNTIVISPKKQDFNLNVLKQYAKMKNTSFKFVYESKDDKWWENIIMKCDIDKSKVYIMPEGITRKEQITKMPEVIEYCLEKGFKFSPRIHVLAYNKKRKV